MNRKDFLKISSLFGGTLLMNMKGVKVHAMENNFFLNDLAKSSTNDKILVLIQLHGGNDGLNTVIPIENYGHYYHHRPNVAIPETGNRKYIQLDPNLPDAKQVGLHPDMIASKEMYDNGEMAVIQNVAYANMNGSHFRSRDIWFMGGDYNESFSSGWMGRYLESQYPGYPENFPNNDVPDPLAIEIGTGVSLAFHRNEGIPMGLSVQNPTAFYNLINSVGGHTPISVPNTYAGDEIEYIMQMEEQSNLYAGRLKQVYDAGNNSNTIYPTMYPFIAPAGAVNNPLSPQLKIISRLISGGIGTKIFLCRIGGFDTHANQVLNNNTTMGGHAALLYHISSAVKAFYDDLKNLGLADRVLTMTFSEFGRRVKSNASYGTDHGNAAPMLVYGTCINAGVYGNSPDLTNLNLQNVPMEHDYRQVFASVIKDWFGASQNAIEAIKFEDWISQRVDYVHCKELNVSELFTKNLHLKCYPNPSEEKFTVSFYSSSSADIRFEIRDMNSRSILKIEQQHFSEGYHELPIALHNQPNGMYFVVMIINNSNIITEKLILNK